ncbi:hypothetical protein GALL_429410 [mine drainage metagenome]|uniref:Uncharacterized protein n=1 Tax=mine drainage metagenome TaxID=410659 RepID=A0A1J5PUX1_9ZZZZ
MPALEHKRRISLAACAIDGFCSERYLVSMYCDAISSTSALSRLRPLPPLERTGSSEDRVSVERYLSTHR